MRWTSPRTSSEEVVSRIERVRVKIKNRDQEGYCQHELTGVALKSWSKLSVSFRSLTPRPRIADSLKEFFTRSKFEGSITPNELAVNGLMCIGFEEYLDRVEALPRPLQAVTALLRLDPQNPHFDDFEKNLTVAEIHHKQWKDKVLDEKSSEMYYFPLAGQWGTRAWETIRAICLDDFSDTEVTQREIIENFQDPEYRELLNKLIRLPDDVFRNYLGSAEVCTVLATGFYEERSPLEGIRFAGNTWVVKTPLHDPEFRELALSLSLKDLRILSIRGNYCKEIEVWRFNARAVKDFRFKESFGSENIESKLVALIQRRAGAFQTPSNYEHTFGFAQLEKGELPPQLPGFYAILYRYLEESGEGQELLSALSEAVPLFFDSDQPGSFGFGFGTYYLLDSLEKATGSAKEAVSLFIEDRLGGYSLDFRDWQNIAKHYDEVRGMNLSIAADLLRIETD